MDEGLEDGVSIVNDVLPPDQTASLHATLENIRKRHLKADSSVLATTTEYQSHNLELGRLYDVYQRNIEFRSIVAADPLRAAVTGILGENVVLIKNGAWFRSHPENDFDRLVAPKHHRGRFALAYVPIPPDDSTVGPIDIERNSHRPTEASGRIVTPSLRPGDAIVLDPRVNHRLDFNSTEERLYLYRLTFQRLSKSFSPAGRSAPIVVAGNDVAIGGGESSRPLGRRIVDRVERIVTSIRSSSD